MNETDKMEMVTSEMSPLGSQDDEEFKRVRHRFWRLGRERRLNIIRKMGFQETTPFSGKDPTAEKTQREMLFYAKKNEEMDTLIALIEAEEAQITEQDESAAYLKVRPPTEFPPTKEELERLKYVPGMKKEV